MLHFASAYQLGKVPGHRAERFVGRDEVDELAQRCTLGELRQRVEQSLFLGGREGQGDRNSGVPSGERRMRAPTLARVG